MSCSNEWHLDIAGGQTGTVTRAGRWRADEHDGDGGRRSRKMWARGSTRPSSFTRRVYPCASVETDSYLASDACYCLLSLTEHGTTHDYPQESPKRQRNADPLPVRDLSKATFP